MTPPVTPPLTPPVTPAPAGPGRSLPGVVWPPLHALGDKGVREIRSLCARTQRMTPDQILGRQFRQLGVLLRHARQTVPFYRARLAAAGIGEDGPDPESWLRIPTLTRRAVQAQGKALGSRRPPALHGRGSTVTTSGSTGMPVTVRRSALTGVFWHAMTAREHLWNGRDVSGKLAVIRVSGDPAAQPPAGKHGRVWGRGALAVGPPGPGTRSSS